MCLVLPCTGLRGNGAQTAQTPLPSQLSETGLYHPGSMSAVRADNIPFSPQYPLCTERKALV